MVLDVCGYVVTARFYYTHSGQLTPVLCAVAFAVEYLACSMATKSRRLCLTNSISIALLKRTICMKLMMIVSHGPQYTLTSETLFHSLHTLFEVISIFLF